MLGRLLLATRSLVLLTTSSLVLLTVGPTLADCSGDDEVTCTGDVYPYVDTSIEGQTDVKSFIFESLTGNAGNGGQDAAIYLQSTGEEGDNHDDASTQGRPLTITFTGGQYGIDSSQYSLFIQSEGGQGHSGNDNGSDGSDSSHSGGGGQPGAAGGALTLDWNSGDIADNRGLWFVSEGNHGGEGGSGKTGTGDTGEGGPGGVGGAGGAVTVTFGADAPVTANAGIFQIAGFGGVGGQGGEGYNGRRRPRAEKAARAVWARTSR